MVSGAKGESRWAYVKHDAMQANSCGRAGTFSKTGATLMNRSKLRAALAFSHIEHPCVDEIYTDLTRV